MLSSMHTGTEASPVPEPNNQGTRYQSHDLKRSRTMAQSIIARLIIPDEIIAIHDTTASFPSDHMESVKSHDSLKLFAPTRRVKFSEPLGCLGPGAIWYGVMGL